MTIAGMGLADDSKGLEIAQKYDQKDMGWKNMTASMEMILRNRHGEESSRSLRNRSLEQENDGDQILVIFDEPKDVQGTCFLSFTHREGPDDQWLYLPALKRVKRISSNNKSGPFMGSEFAYEDITSEEVDKYQYQYIQDETIDNINCYVVERYPVDPNSGYTKQVAWYDQLEYRIMKIDFYDRKNTLLKTLYYKNYQQYLNQYWRADIMHMVNHQTGKESELKWSHIQFQTDVNPADFNANALKRIR